jgi:hypothetical protein
MASAANIQNGAGCRPTLDVYEVELTEIGEEHDKSFAKIVRWVREVVPTRSI